MLSAFAVSVSTTLSKSNNSALQILIYRVKKRGEGEKRKGESKVKKKG